MSKEKQLHVSLTMIKHLLTAENPICIESFIQLQVSEWLSRSSAPRGAKGTLPEKLGWGCAAQLSKPLSSMRVKSAIYPI